MKQVRREWLIQWSDGTVFRVKPGDWRLIHSLPEEKAEIARQPVHIRDVLVLRGNPHTLFCSLRLFRTCNDMHARECLS